jgi:uncharacterized membrane protein
MSTSRRAAIAFALPLALSACGEREAAAPADPSNRTAAKVEAAAPAPEPAATPAATPAAPRTGPWSATGYALNGTEPFWGGSLTGTTVRYMVPEDQFGDVVETRAAFSPDRETYSGAYRGHPFLLTLTRGPCSDGMSDRVYAFSAELRVRGEVRRGCADPQ